MAVYLNQEGVEECVSRMKTAIEELQSAASKVDMAMLDISAHWQGAAHDRTQATYAENYKTLLTTTVPQQVEAFKIFIEDCKNAIIETDNQLSGR